MGAGVDTEVRHEKVIELIQQPLSVTREWENHIGLVILA